jgi:FdhD protein
MTERVADLAAQRFTAARRVPVSEAVAVEEPVEISIDGQVFAVTMRTPGNDAALVHGLLLSEGVIRDKGDITVSAPEDGRVEVTLSKGVSWQPEQHSRSFNRTSACGVCGRTSLDAVLAAEPPDINGSRPFLSPEIIEGLGGSLKQAQEDFESTGGMHAVARFGVSGEIIDIAEDVGRHNAMDKVVGDAMLTGELPLSDEGLMLSGRVSFEMVQKAVMAGCPIIAAIGAPTTLAVDLARQHGLTLIGFLRDGRFNVYSGAHRIRG